MNRVRRLLVDVPENVLIGAFDVLSKKAIPLDEFVTSKLEEIVQESKKGESK